MTTSARPENAGLRLSVVGSIQRTDLPTEQPVIPDLPFRVLSYAPKGERKTVMDTRHGRRGTALHALTDPSENPGDLVVLSIPRALAALLLGGEASQRAVAASTVSTPEAHRFQVGLAYQLAGRNVGSVVVYPGVRATLDTGVVLSNNALIWTAKTAGTGGNSITVTLIDPSGNNVPLSVAVDATDIVVTCATDGSSAITSTAAEVLAAIEASTAATALVTVAHKSTSTGAAAVAAVAETALSGGTNTGTALIAGTDYEVINAAEGQVRPLAGGALGADGDSGTCWTTYTTGSIEGWRIAAGKFVSFEARIVAAGVNDAMNDAGVTGAACRAEIPRALLTTKGVPDLLAEDPLKLEFEYLPLAPADGSEPFFLDYPHYGTPA